MYFVAKKLKKKYNITDERAALYEAAETWVNALNGREFLGMILDFRLPKFLYCTIISDRDIDTLKVKASETWSLMVKQPFLFHGWKVSEIFRLKLGYSKAWRMRLNI